MVEGEKGEAQTLETPQGGSASDLVSQLKELAAQPNASEKLAEKLSSDWRWLQSIAVGDPQALRQKITSGRSAVQETVETAKMVVGKAEMAMTSFTTMPDSVQGAYDPHSAQYCMGANLHP